MEELNLARRNKEIKISRNRVIIAMSACRMCVVLIKLIYKAAIAAIQTNTCDTNGRIIMRSHAQALDLCSY